MTRKITLGLVAVMMSSCIFGLPFAGSTSTQSTPSNQDPRKEPGFDPLKFQNEDLTPLLKNKFSNGRHIIKKFADSSKLSIETKNNKIRRAFLIEPDGSQSEATIHSPTNNATVRSFTLGVHVKTPLGEKCWICTFGRESQQGAGTAVGATARSRQRLVKCHSAPCDDFYPEPDPPQIDPLKKSNKNMGRMK